MDYPVYIDLFQQAADRLDTNRLAEKNLELHVGTILNSVVLKLYKKAWTSGSPDPITAPSRIFFSVWVSDAGIRTGKLFYNIHALKLRQLKGYTIKSREFAQSFRAAFKNFQHDWPNVSVDYGPLTLMEGWRKLEPETLPHDIAELAGHFLTIAHLIDDTLK